MRIRVLKVLRRVNVVRTACDHMMGPNHSTVHRILAGGVVMLVGVVLAKYAGHHEVVVVQYVGDLVGYGIHGLGLTPIAEVLLEDVEATV